MASRVDRVGGAHARICGAACGRFYRCRLRAISCRLRDANPRPNKQLVSKALRLCRAAVRSGAARILTDQVASVPRLVHRACVRFACLWGRGVFGGLRTRVRKLCGVITEAMERATWIAAVREKPESARVIAARTQHDYGYHTYCLHDPPAAITRCAPLVLLSARGTCRKLVSAGAACVQPLSAHTGPSPVRILSGVVSVRPHRPHWPEWYTRTLSDSMLRQNHSNAFALGASTPIRLLPLW